MIPLSPTKRPQDVCNEVEGFFGPVDDGHGARVGRFVDFFEVGHPTGPVHRRGAEGRLALHGDLDAPIAAVAVKGEAVGPVAPMTRKDEAFDAVDGRLLPCEITASQGRRSIGVQVELPTTARVGEGPAAEPSVEACLASHPASG